jgi:hypothetical protein
MNHWLSELINLSKKSINRPKKPPFFNKKIYFVVAKLIPKFATATLGMIF